MSDEKTHAQRPTPRRPKHLWYAWEATVGHIHSNHSADATLRLTIHPLEHYIGWGASLTWGTQREAVDEKVDFAIALNDLWAVIEQNHQVIKTLEAAARRPVNYADDQVLDAPTYQVFSSLINTTDTLFRGDWQILIIYRPIETADKRVQARLTADRHKVNRAGNGPTLREACRSLLRNTASVFNQYRNQLSG
ncbi:MAG: hypothetical protein ACFE0Q_06500 [Anaerolineae bacterium]